jgi:hypothetical protein
MPTAPTIKPTHKAIQSYYDTLHQFSGQHVEHESAVRSAFQRLLEDTAKTPPLDAHPRPDDRNGEA